MFQETAESDRELKVLKNDNYKTKMIETRTFDSAKAETRMLAYVNKQVRGFHEFDHVLELSRIAYFRDHFRQESAHFFEIFHFEQTTSTN
jgi:hypothetical protein